MNEIFNSKEFRKAIVTKRVVQEDWTVTKAALEIGISKATLSRLENKHLPDVETFAKVCKWLGAKPELFFNY